jgi:hypothetical protein
LALTSPTSGGRSVGIVRLRTKAAEFSFSFSEYFNNQLSLQSNEPTHKAKHFLPMEAVLLGMLSLRDTVP